MNRYIIRKYADNWKDIGIELGLSFPEINEVERHQRSWFGNKDSLREILNNWLKKTNDATWKAVEIALTNVNRLNLQLNPVDDLYVVDAVDVPASKKNSKYSKFIYIATCTYVLTGCIFFSMQ